MHDIQPLRSTDLVQRVSDGIRSHIINNGMAAGTPLPSESQLAQSFGVSRNVVREAVKALATMGIINVQRGSGLFVQEFSFAPLVANLPYGLLTHVRPLTELLELRELLELGLIDRIAREHSESDLQRVDRALQDMRAKAVEGEVFQEEDRVFHRALFSIAANSMILELIDVFWMAFKESARMWPPQDDPLTTYHLHVDIADAVRRHDAEAARDALRRHYEDIERRLNEAADTGAEDSPVQHSLERDDSTRSRLT